MLRSPFPNQAAANACPKSVSMLVLLRAIHAFLRVSSSRLKRSTPYIKLVLSNPEPRLPSTPSLTAAAAAAFSSLGLVSHEVACLQVCLRVLTQRKLRSSAQMVTNSLEFLRSDKLLWEDGTLSCVSYRHRHSMCSRCREQECKYCCGRAGARWPKPYRMSAAFGGG